MILPELHPIILIIHNLMRWVVVITAVLALVNAYRGWLGKRAFTPADKRFGTFFSISLDIQFLAGLILFFVSPLINVMFASGMGTAMGSPEIRFFSVEHTLLMFIAVVLGHVGVVMSRRAGDDNTKYRNMAIFFTLSVLLILIAIPWPAPLDFYAPARPLFRLGM